MRQGGRRRGFGAGGRNLLGVGRVDGVGELHPNPPAVPGLLGGASLELEGVVLGHPGLESGHFELGIAHELVPGVVLAVGYGVEIPDVSVVDEAAEEVGRVRHFTRQFVVPPEGGEDNGHGQ